ncbi:DUF5610 domain-containing protein [Catenovulum sediminis]|uniref:DUF5610 domain-containing protein n=1 Tax=Catenovulum sediminis TaxID=1740262 RepID=A0ABV1RBS0_9ALTE
MDISSIKNSSAQLPTNKSDNKNTAEQHSAVKSDPSGVVGSQAVETHLSRQSTLSFGVTILQQSFARHLDSLPANKPMAMGEPLTPSDIKARNESLFNFEEVAKNVLSFVEGVVLGAAESGADKESLNELIEQAREGVSKGVAAAKKQLGITEETDDPLSQGIKKAHDLIKEGIDGLFERINNPEKHMSGQTVDIGIENQITAKDTGKLQITTKDGDTVFIDFSSIRAQQETARMTAQQEGEQNSSQFVYNKLDFNEERLAYTVEGELDEEELQAIGQFVQSVSSVAESFYGGDVEAAYQQALKLGFDDSEISSYAVQLTRERSHTQTAYQSVSEYQNHGLDKPVMPKSVQQPLMEYVEELKNMVAQGRQHLADEGQIQDIMNRVFSNQFQLEGNELMEAVNRFNHFNRQILGQQEGDAAE